MKLARFLGSAEIEAFNKIGNYNVYNVPAFHLFIFKAAFHFESFFFIFNDNVFTTCYR